MTSVPSLADKEKTTSGYPSLAPSPFALSQSIVDIIHQLQTREKWNNALSSILGERSVSSVTCQ